MNPSENDPPRDEEESAATGETGSESKPDARATGYNPMVPHGSTGPNRETATTKSQTAELDAEYVREETERNDAVIRWAVVLVAFVAAWTPVFQTEVLVRVRTGEYLAANGFLPPRSDVFSHAAADRTWVNTEWLFDLVLAGVYGGLGAFGLTLLKAVLAAVTFGFVVSIVRPGASSWWSSICAAVAVMVCPLRFSALPESVTLLGLAIVLWVFTRWRQSGGSLWALVPVFLVWANTDSRMFLGLAFLLLYGLGELASGALSSPAAFDSSDHRRHFWMVTAACVVAALVNPFGWETLLAPLRLYGTYYPSLQSLVDPSRYRNLQLFPMTAPEFWEQLDIAAVSGLFLLGAAFVAAALNHRRLDAGALFAVAGFTAVAVAAVHELAAAAVVAAVLGSLAASDWYSEVRPRATTAGALGLARAGRALTVFGLIGITLLAMTGRLTGTPRLGLGYGFDNALRTRIESLEATLARIPAEYRGFNTTLSQGDLLIWHGRPTFVDRRAALLGAEPSLYDTFVELAGQLSQDATAGGGMLVAPTTESVLDPYEVDFAIAELRGAVPSDGYRQLFVSPLWRLVEVGGSEAVFVRYVPSDDVPPGGDEVVARNGFARENGFNPSGQAFDHDSASIDQRGDVGHEAVFSGWLFSSREPTTPQLGRSRTLYQHVLWAHQGRFGNQLPIGLVYGFAYLSLQESNRALVGDSQQSDAYRLLGQTHWYLASYLEPMAFGNDAAARERLKGYAGIEEFRRLQAVNELTQAVRVDPDNFDAWTALLTIHSLRGRTELALESARGAVRAARNRGLVADESTNEELRSLLEGELVEAFESRVFDVQQGAEALVAQQKKNLEVMTFCVQNGATNSALATFERHLESNPMERSNLDSMLAYVRLLLEAGRLEDAAREIAQAERIPDAADNLALAKLGAIAAASAGRHEGAIEILKRHRDRFLDLRNEFWFGHLPFAVAAPVSQSPNEAFWAASSPVRTRHATLTAPAFNGRAAELTTLILLLQLESARIEDATQSAEALLNQHVDHGTIPLVFQYGQLLGVVRTGNATPETPAGESNDGKGKDTEPPMKGTDAEPNDAKPSDAKPNEEEKADDADEDTPAPERD